MDIRPEEPGDVKNIYVLTKAAFEPMAFSDGTEADCVDRLRADGDLVLSLVAIDRGDLAGHIAFSPADVSGSDGRWIGLGPVSVWPKQQRAGIGGALIKTGLGKMRESGFCGCVLIGNPVYYRRFGFAGDGRLSYRNLPADIVQWLSFDGTKPSGVVKFSPGLE